jgi:hypothetical protein
MKPSDPASEYVLLKHFARDKGLAYQSLRDAAARREFDVLEVGRPDSERPHIYARRADLAAWLLAHTRKRSLSMPIATAARRRA